MHTEMPTGSTTGSTAQTPAESMESRTRKVIQWIERNVGGRVTHIDPQARWRGVARALIEAVYAAADAAGVPAVYWLTAEDNYAGRMLYDKVAQRSPFIRYQRRLG